MDISTIIFYLIAAFILGMAILAVTAKHIFRSAIWLLFTLIGIASLYFWMEVEFIAAVQIVVYVGGIVVLIIFSILLTQQAGEKMKDPSMGRRIASALAAFCGLAIILLQVFKHSFPPVAENAVTPDVKQIGQQLLDIDKNGLALPFEVISILLLAAMVGCIVIALKGGRS